MKKQIAILLVAALSLSFAGCGAGETTVSENTSIETLVSEETSTEVSKTETSETETSETEVVSEVEQEDMPLVILEGGEVNEYCLEMRDVFVDFTSANQPENAMVVEKRSETNVVLYMNKNKDNAYDIQYSASGVDVGSTNRLAVVFSDGYEEYHDEFYGDMLYTFEEEENGTRIIVLQDIGAAQYISIRCFNKTDIDSEELMKQIIIKHYPIYRK